MGFGGWTALGLEIITFTLITLVAFKDFIDNVTTENARIGNLLTLTVTS